MKLKCVTHKRRVVQGQKSWIHRNGDGSTCEGNLVFIGTQQFGFGDASFISVANSVKN